MPPPFGNVVRVSCRGIQGGGETWANVWHIRGLLPPVVEQATADLLAAPFRDFYAASGNSDRHNQWSLTEIWVTDLSTVAGPSFSADDTSAGLPLTGTSASAPLPYQCAMVLSLRTAIQTRRGRGRIYLSGYTVGQVAENADGSPTVPSALRSSVRSAAVALQADLATADPNNEYGIAVLSEVAGLANFVTEVRTGSRWDTQRRRRRSLVESYTSSNITPPS